MAKTKDKILLWIVDNVGWRLIRFICSTIGLKVIGEEVLNEYKKNGQNVIFTFWHDTQLFFVYYYRNRNIQVLISESRDGEYIARTIESLGFTAIRGSSSHGGMRAILALNNKLEKGLDAGITPDGPRGPRHVLKEGVIILSQKTGCPIIPITFSSNRIKSFNSWDKFLFPYPFSKGVLIYGKSFIIPKTCVPNELKKYKIEVETELNRIWDEAENYYKKVK